MNGIHTCTLVLEFNYGASDASKSSGSVWLFNGNGSSDLEQETPLATRSNWVKIVGPIDYEEASAIHANLKRFFEINGVFVLNQGVAD